jgi:hypothetical protein
MKFINMSLSPKERLMVYGDSGKTAKEREQNTKAKHTPIEEKGEIKHDASLPCVFVRKGNEESKRIGRRERDFGCRGSPKNYR